MLAPSSYGSSTGSATLFRARALGDFVCPPARRGVSAVCFRGSRYCSIASGSLWPEAVSSVLPRWRPAHSCGDRSQNSLKHDKHPAPRRDPWSGPKVSEMIQRSYDDVRAVRPQLKSLIERALWPASEVNLSTAPSLARTERLLSDANDARGLVHRLALADIEVNQRLTQHRSHFNSQQPRVPAGNPDGGQWTSTGALADLEYVLRLPTSRTLVRTRLSRSR